MKTDYIVLFTHSLNHSMVSGRQNLEFNLYGGIPFIMLIWNKCSSLLISGDVEIRFFIGCLMTG